MEWLVAVVFFFIGVAWWVSQQKEETSKAKDLARDSREELKALKWARDLVDIDAAKDDLREQILAEENREARAWDEFRQTWKPGLLLRFYKWQARHSIYQPDLTQHARQAFFRGFDSRMSLLMARQQALMNESRSREAHPLE